MSLDTTDFILLEYLAGIDGPAEVSEENMPHEIRDNLKFFSRSGDPDNMYTRLPKLESYGFIKSVNGACWQITEEGRKKLVDFIRQLRAEKEELRKEAEHREAEHKRALSALEINENQKKLARKNRLFAIINIIIGLVNIVLLIGQLVKAAQ